MKQVSFISTFLFPILNLSHLNALGIYVAVACGLNSKSRIYSDVVI